MGVPHLSFFFFRIFHTKPSSYWGIPTGNLLKWRDFFRTATEFLRGRHDVCVGAADEHRGLLLAFGMEPIGRHFLDH